MKAEFPELGDAVLVEVDGNVHSGTLAEVEDGEALIDAVMTVRVPLDRVSRVFRTAPPTARGEDPEKRPPSGGTTWWDDDQVQFMRLLAEMRAVVEFTPEQIEALSDTMDLGPGYITELLDRADDAWEKYKEARIR